MICYLIKVGNPCSLACDPLPPFSKPETKGRVFLVLPFLCGQENLSTYKDLCDYIGLTCIIQNQSPHCKALTLSTFISSKCFCVTDNLAFDLSEVLGNHCTDAPFVYLH